MKFFSTLLVIILASSFMNAQNCNAYFGYTIGANNVVTIIDSSTSSCPLNIQYNFGDTASGFFNNNGANTHFYKNAGTYTICQYVSSNTSTCSNACIDTFCTQIILPNNGTACQAAYSVNVSGLNCSFSNISTSDDPTVNFIWDFGNGTTSATYNPNQTYPIGATYPICLYLEASDGCQSVVCSDILVDGISVYYYNTVGIDKNETTNSYTIFPNPFSAQTILNTSKYFTNADLLIYNSCGQQVKQIKNISGQAITIDRGCLPQGLYFLKLMQNNEIYLNQKLLLTDD